MIKPKRIGHVVLKVKNLERSEKFYTEVLGLRIVDRLGDKMTFFSWEDNHHDLAIYAVGDDAEDTRRKQVGLFHVAMQIGSYGELQRAYRFLKEKGVPIRGTSDHGVSKSIYLADPDGNEIEIFSDTLPSEWENGVRPRVAQIMPLDLEAETGVRG